MILVCWFAVAGLVWLCFVFVICCWVFDFPGCFMMVCLDFGFWWFVCVCFHGFGSCLFEMV